MKWLVPLLVIVPAALSGTRPLSPYALVRSESAEFFFPVPGIDQTWAWSRQETAADALEYGWTVEVSLGNSNYRVSAQKFKFPKAIRRQGSFEDLSHDLQTQLWKERGGGRYKIERAEPVGVRPDKGGLILQLDAPRFVAKLRSARPKTLVFLTEGSVLRPTRIEVPVRYLD